VPRKTPQKNRKKSEAKQRKQIERDLDLILSGRYPTYRSARKSNLLELDEQEYLREIESESAKPTNGPLVGILITSVFTSFSGGLLLGALALVSGLVQWWLTPQPEQQRQRAEDQKYNPAYGGQVGQLAKLGQPIPAIFCSVANDQTGGVQTGGDIIYGEIGTYNGSQFAKIRYVLSHGEIGNISLTDTTLNDQPIASFGSTTVTLAQQKGTLTQTVPAGYDQFCQNVPVSVNNAVLGKLITGAPQLSSQFIVDDLSQITIGTLYSLTENNGYAFTVTAIDVPTKLVTVTPASNYSNGVHLSLVSNITVAVATIVGQPPTTATTNISVTASEFEGFGSGSLYVAVYPGGTTQFRIVGKSRVVYALTGAEVFTITTSVPVPSAGITQIYSYQSAYYQSTKRVTELHLNFLAQVWARDTNGGLIDFAQAYKLEMRQYNTGTYTPIANFIIRSKNPARLYRSIEIINLPLAPYAVRITPIITVVAGLPIYDIQDAGTVNTFVTGINVSNTGVAIPSLRFQGTITTLTIAQINALIDQNKSRTPDNSVQSAPTLVIQNVNEIEANGASGRPVNLGLPGLAGVTAKINFNESISGQVNLLFFVDEGIITHKLLAAGTADASTPTVLTYAAGHGRTFASGLYLRNTDQRIESQVIAMTATTITTSTPLNWVVGDNWYLSSRHSSCWLPEIYSWLATDPRFGVARRVIADHYLDWPILVENTRWVEGANEHAQFFAWHGIISGTQELAVWNNDQAKKVMLEPWFGRRKAYEPHRTPVNMPAPVIYNGSNSKNASLKYTTLDINPNNICNVIYSHKEVRQTDEPSLLINKQDVNADTWQVARGLVDPKVLTITNLECTSIAQAKKQAQLTLNIARYKGRMALSLDAIDIESIGLRLGNAIRVQTYNTKYRDEYQGAVIETNASGFRISQVLQLAEGLSTDANTVGLTDANANFIRAGIVVGDLVLNIETGVTSPITAVTSTTITCVPIIPIDFYYKIIDLTHTTSVIATPGQPPRPFTSSVIANQVWLKVAGVQPEVSDPIAIGSINTYDRYFQAVAIEPDYGRPSEDGKREYRVNITGTNWTPKLFDYSDIRVKDRDGVYNPPI
jgi:hypothetical protein